ncbi:NadB Aspartate oxidase [Burkholderiales bacterium]
MLQAPSPLSHTMTPPLIIIGSGLAGLTVALEAADHIPVKILAKRSLEESATAWAQGGIVGVIDESDDIESHVQDTLIAGAGLVVEPVARHIAEHSAAAIRWLLDQGVPFTPDPQGPEGLHLVKEGGHSHRRIAHAADATGKAIHDVLLAKAKAHPNIELMEGWMAVDLIIRKHLAGRREAGKAKPAQGCYGVYALNLATQQVEAIAAGAVVLATGGAGKVYRYTSNPETATGDGIAMAWRAGCRVANMEFIQFHPTCLYHPDDRTFLITEALRGEGALLELPDGTRFMPQHDARAELAPRDVVARAIDFEMKRHGLDFVHLNATHLGRAFLQEHFPTIYARCMSLGIDIAEQCIPVVPAAHYTCGGVVTDLSGLSDLPGLYAVGETGYTGLHGANRLASNSLLECVVVGKAAAQHIRSHLRPDMPDLLAWDESLVEDADEAVVISHNWDELRLLMWNYVGIVRTTRRLERALHRIDLLKEEVNEYYRNFRISRDLLELRNLLECAELIVRSALTRKESRGLHYSRDYPQPWGVSYPTILTPIKQRVRSSPPL